MKINIPKEPTLVLNLLIDYGFDAYIVGGCVRDALLERKPQDWDICTNALPEEMMKIFNSQSLKVIETGIKHGTITVIYESMHLEITTYRIDGEYVDHRRPERVVFTNSLEEDLSRRDFTINAMAYNHTVGLIDYFKGQLDLKNKVIKCVGSAEKRFFEDALRILRGIRFATQLNFQLDSNTKHAMYMRGVLLKSISKERIRDEFIKLLLSDYPSKGMELLKNVNVLNYILPELMDMILSDQKHILSVLDNTPKIIEVRLAALLHHFKNEGVVMDVLKRLKFDNKTLDGVCNIIKEHINGYAFLNTKDIKQFINRVGIDKLDLFFAFEISHNKGESAQNFDIILNIKSKIDEILDKKYPLTIKDLAINGTDLIALGIPHGKQIGVLLNTLLDKVLEDPELNSKESLIKIVNKIY